MGTGRVSERVLHNMKSDNVAPYTTPQIQFFKGKGILVIKSMVELGTLETWRKQIWPYFNSQLETSETWPNDRQIDGLTFEHTEPAFPR